MKTVTISLPDELYNKIHKASDGKVGQRLRIIAANTFGFELPVIQKGAPKGNQYAKGKRSPQTDAEKALYVEYKNKIKNLREKTTVIPRVKDHTEMTPAELYKNWRTIPKEYRVRVHPEHGGAVFYPDEEMTQQIEVFKPEHNLYDEDNTPQQVGVSTQALLDNL